jgi:hypothetical protein
MPQTSRKVALPRHGTRALCAICGIASQIRARGTNRNTGYRSISPLLAALVSSLKFFNRFFNRFDCRNKNSARLRAWRGTDFCTGQSRSYFENVTNDEVCPPNCRRDILVRHKKQLASCLLRTTLKNEVPKVGLEPTLCCQNWILNPALSPAISSKSDNYEL